MSEFALNLAGVHKSFGSKAVLRGVDLSPYGSRNMECLDFHGCHRSLGRIAFSSGAAQMGEGRNGLRR
jgi:ABC-type histidine transport system ATPase subunit